MKQYILAQNQINKIGQEDIRRQTCCLIFCLNSSSPFRDEIQELHTSLGGSMAIVTDKPWEQIERISLSWTKV